MILARRFLIQVNHIDTVLNLFYRTAIDYDVLNINLINPATKIIYGMGEDNTYFMCPATPIGKCALISKTDYDTAKVVSGVVQAKVVDKITVTDDASSKLPDNADTFIMQNSKKIGGKNEHCIDMNFDWLKLWISVQCYFTLEIPLIFC